MDINQIELLKSKFLNSGTAPKNFILLKATVSATLFAALYLSSFYSYLLFHSIAELFSIMIAFALFVVSWNTRDYTSEPNLIFLGIAYLFVGILDLFHTLSYKGMNIFTDYQFYANQLWVGARYMESISLLIFVFLSRPDSHFPDTICKQNSQLCDTVSRQDRPLPYIKLIVLYALISSIIMLSIFYWKNFPVCFVQTSSDGRGYQTLFKIVSGYSVILILAITAFFMKLWKDALSPPIHQMLVWSVAATIGSEFCFTLYISNYGGANQIGHYLKIVSFYMIYSSIIQTGLRNPFTVMFRTLMENQEQLCIAKEAAESANHAKSQFLTNMSHEIRTPLNSILGFSSILKMAVSDPMQKNYLDAIHLSGKHLLTIFNDILDLSKIEAGRLNISYVPISLTALFMEIESLFAIKAAEKHIEFKIEISPEISSLEILENRESPPVLPEISLSDSSPTASPNLTYLAFMMDEVRMRQILFNLVGNAVKFTDAGHILIAAECMACDKDQYTDDETKVELKISISDTGIGMTDTFLKEIFTPFSQQDGQLTRKYGGTGLGLAITRRLVEMMGGSITVQSQVGIGSRFEIVFPHVRVRRIKAMQRDLINSSKVVQESRMGSSMHLNEISTYSSTCDAVDKELRYLSNFSDIILLLQGEVMSEWEMACQNQHIPDIELFARRVRSLGEEHDIASLAQFGAELLGYINAFDINRIQFTLKNFPDLVAMVSIFQNQESFGKLTENL